MEAEDLFYNHGINPPFIIWLHRGNACFAHAVSVRECFLNGCCHFPAVCGINDIPVPARDYLLRQVARIIDNNRFAAGHDRRTRRTRRTKWTRRAP